MPVLASLSSCSPAAHKDLGGSGTSFEMVISVSGPFSGQTGHNFSSRSMLPVYVANPGHPVFASAALPIPNSSPGVHSPALYSLFITGISSASK